jgi:hypothetical protein
MSRAATPPQTQPMPPQQAGNQLKIPHDKIAMRAYEKWVKRGKQPGNPEKDWHEAEAELKAEFSRGGQVPSPGASPVRR